MSRYKIESSRSSLPSDLEELLELFETERYIRGFAKDLVLKINGKNGLVYKNVVIANKMKMIYY